MQLETVIDEPAARSESTRFARRPLTRLAPGRCARLGDRRFGGPDSLACCCSPRGAAGRMVEAATVDHGLRAESADEAAMVAGICDELGVPHRTLLADWSEPPTANVQAEARAMRYRLLNEWAIDRGLPAVATAHHADDQAETLLMRLARGAGVGGLGGDQGKAATVGAGDAGPAAAGLAQGGAGGRWSRKPDSIRSTIPATAIRGMTGAGSATCCTMPTGPTPRGWRPARRRCAMPTRRSTGRWPR